MSIKKQLFKSGPYSDFFSQGVKTGNILTLAGQLGDDSEGNTPNELKSQMENCYKNIEIILKEFDASLDDLIDETWFVTNMEECMGNVSELFGLREEIFGCKPEVSQTLVEVSNLVDSLSLIHI